MFTRLTLLVLFFCSSFCFGQNITLKGKITDSSDIPLESATVYLTSAKDSTVIMYTITGKNGEWELKTRKIENPVHLKVAFVSMANYTEALTSITEDRDFGTIKLADESTEINEVVIEGEVPPIRIKSDTLEFNASSFKVRPDANVETLLKQLPGVDIDEEGKITVNGKEVNQILVNGKPFFDKDGKVALKNLPAEIINKVQVTDTKTKKEELSGQKASGDNASINLTLDDGKNKGVFGKVMGGYGSDDRYESSALVNYFKDETKISLLASSNNINSAGFSMDEIFDSMGGGRNYSIYTGDDGSFGINGMRFGGGAGITQSNILGLNYADEWTKNFGGSTNYFYSSANTENQNRTNQVNFLPVREDENNPGTFIDDSYSTESVSTTENDKYAHNFNSEFNFKIDSTATIYFTPKFSKANSKTTTSSNRLSQRVSDERLLNDSEASTYDENDNTSFTSNMYFNKSFNKKGRSIGASFQNENRKDDGNNYNRSVTNKYSYEGDIQTVETDDRNQVLYNRRTTDEYNFGIDYTEPITDSLEVQLGVNYEINKALENRDGFDFDAATGDFTSYNDALSNYITSESDKIVPTAGFNLQKKDFYVYLTTGTQIIKFDNYAFYMGNDYNLKKEYMLPTGNLNMRYSFTKSKSLGLWYSYDVNLPSGGQVLPVEDVSNPLYTYIGNPNLDPNKSHYMSLNFRDYDFATRSGYSFYMGGSLYDSQIVSYSVIDESAKTTTTYKNVSGTVNMWFGGNWNKSIKTEGGHTYKFSLGANAGYNINKGYLNGELYDANSIRFTPRAGFTYEFTDLVTINPIYSFTYNETNYNNYSISSASNFLHKANIQVTTYWPKHVVFGNDFGYTYNSQISDGFKKDFYLWNTSVGYNFYQDRLMFKVKVYDVLNQNLGTSRTITATTIRDEENIVLKRYVMFSLTFKLNKFGKDKKDEGRSRFFMF